MKKWPRTVDWKSRGRNTNVFRGGEGQVSKGYVSDQSSECPLFLSLWSMVWPGKIRNPHPFPTCRYPLNNLCLILVIFGHISSCFQTFEACSYDRYDLSIIDTIIWKHWEHLDGFVTNFYLGWCISYVFGIWIVYTVHDSVILFRDIFLGHFLATLFIKYAHYLSWVGISERTNLGHTGYQHDNTHIWLIWLCMTSMSLFRCYWPNTDTTVSAKST